MMFNDHNVRISSKAKIGQNVRIGDDSVIYDNVTIGDNSTIANNCSIGEPTSEFYSTSDYKHPRTVIGSNSLIRSNAIIYAGVMIGTNLETGHRCTIREGSIIGDNCRIGTLCDLQGHLEIGDYCNLHSSVHLCQHSKLGDYVFLYPYVVLANDKYPPSEEVIGPEIGGYSQIGVHSVVIGKVKIGANCLLGARTTVTKDVDDFSFVVGSPSKRLSDVREITSEQGKQLYPWSARFSRGMPWKKD